MLKVGQIVERQIKSEIRSTISGILYIIWAKNGTHILADFLPYTWGVELILDKIWRSEKRSLQLF